MGIVFEVLLMVISLNEISNLKTFLRVGRVGFGGRTALEELACSAGPSTWCRSTTSTSLVEPLGLETG